MFGSANQVGIDIKISADASGAVAGISSASSSLDKLTNGIHKRVTGTLKRGLQAGGVAAGAALGTALYKGFGRLTAIDQAEAKLRGLGHSTESIAAIMDNALGSVRGTAFGLDEAASTAAGTVAAGIAPGKELERVLKLTADTATIAGSSMGEMGSIFNKVAASNRLSMGEVNQLADRGVPIMQMLADQYGVTASEARKMVEKGKVDFADFSTAIEDNIAGAALESGATFSGAFDNMLAAAGRVGAQLLSGIFPQMTGGFGSITEAIDNLGPAAEEIGIKLGDWAATASEKLLPAIESLVGWIVDSFIPGLVEMGTWIQNNRAWLEPLAVMLGTAALTITAIVEAVKLWTAAQTVLNAVLAANPIGIVVVALAALVAGLIWAWHNVDGFRDGVIAAWDWISAKTTAVWSWITQTVPAWIGDMTSRAIALFTGLRDDTVARVTQLKDDALARVTQLKDDAIARVTELKDKVVNFFTDMKTKAVAKATELKNDVLSRLRAMPGEALSIGRNIISGLISGVTGAAGRLGDAAVNAVKSAFSRAKSWLGIRSPSTLWRDQIGKMMGAGAAEGLAASTHQLRDEARKLLRVPNDLATPIDIPVGLRSTSTHTTAPTRPSRAPVIINVNGALDPTAVARQIRRLLADEALLTGRTT